MQGITHAFVRTWMKEKIIGKGMNKFVLKFKILSKLGKISICMYESKFLRNTKVMKFSIPRYHTSVNI